EGYSGRLTLVGEELHAPYDRPPLSKEFLRGEIGAERLALRKKPYDELALDLRLGERAEALDLGARVATLSSGERLPFDGLVVATGARPRMLPGLGGERGGHALRALDDARRLAADLRGARRAVVVGAGFIGLEVAASCRAM